MTEQETRHGVTDARLRPVFSKKFHAAGTTVQVRRRGLKGAVIHLMAEEDANCFPVELLPHGGSERVRIRD